MNMDYFLKSPINIDLLKVDEKNKVTLKEVKTAEIFSNNNNFHSEGLYSNQIFGANGTEIRNRTFGYIDLKINILHPMIYTAISNLKNFYEKILNGSLLAEFNKEKGEFIKSNSPSADTGYHFFIKHIEDLKFEKNNSDTRNFYIDLLDKAIKEKTYSLRYHLVLPAGLRDYTIDANGKPQEDEINKLYRKLIFHSSFIDKDIAIRNPSSYDSIRYSLQNASNEIFEYIKSLLEGKHKLIMGKWLTRKIFNSTRNVLTGQIEPIANIDDPARLGYNEVYIGIHQFLRALVPKSIYEIKNAYIKDIFVENNTFAYLTNSKTLKKEEVLSTHIQKKYDLWTSSEGIEKVIASLNNLDLRHLPITLNKNKHYMGLLYRDDKYFKFIQDIDELPDGYDKNKVSPITLAEFLYISCHHLSGNFPGFLTRYPITGYGSIIPVNAKLLTTSRSLSLERLDDNWSPSGDIAHSFPIRNLEFFNAISVHVSKYGKLQADVDGDTVSFTAVLTDEAKNEVDEYFKKRNYYISPEREFYFGISTDTLDATLSYMTG